MQKVVHASTFDGSVIIRITNNKQAGKCFIDLIFLLDARVTIMPDSLYVNKPINCDMLLP
jgi:hypothetical protein